MRVRGVAACVAVLLAASPAIAEERFYPVMGPDGRIQMLRGEAKGADRPATPAPADRPSTPERADGPATPEPADGPATPEPAERSAAPAAAGGGLPHAPYDSDEYVDAEAMDAATRPADTGRRRFYLINDGLGPRITDSGTETEAESAPAPAAAPVGAERWEAVEGPRRRWTAAEAATAMPWLPRCLEGERLRALPGMTFADATGRVVTEQDYAFLDGSRVLAGWQVEGEGLRTLVLRSYSRKSRSPAFLDPRLAFLDAEGCVTRVVQGFFDRRYAATDRRHVHLWGEQVVHTGEAWLLLLAPPDDEQSAGIAPWRVSRVGQLKFTLKK